MLFLKKVTDDMRLLLQAMQMATHAIDHFRLAGRPALAHRVGFHILIEQLIGVQLGTVSGQPYQAQPLSIFRDELPN